MLESGDLDAELLWFFWRCEGEEGEETENREMGAGQFNKQGRYSTGPTKPASSILGWLHATCMKIHQVFRTCLLRRYIRRSTTSMLAQNPRDCPPTLFQHQKEICSTLDSSFVNITVLHLGSGVLQNTIRVRTANARSWTTSTVVWTSTIVSHCPLSTLH